ncbi:MAG: hypothetical protein ACTSVL_10220 [Promethearchaeota archaeon]
MIKITNKKSKAPLLIIGILVFSLFIQFSGSSIAVSNSNTADSSNNIPITATMDEGTQVIEHEGKDLNSLGEISVYNILDIPDPIDKDYIADKINVNFTHTHKINFLGTINTANAERAIGNQADRNSNVTIRLNETVTWEYSNETTNYILGFSPSLQSNTQLHSISLNDTVANESQYYTETLVDRTAFYFNFTTQFNNSSVGKLILHYIYDVDILISKWSCQSIMEQDEQGNAIGDVQFQYMKNKTNILTEPFEYNATFGSADHLLDVKVKFKIALPAPDKIYDVDILNYNGQELVQNINYTISDNEITLNLWSSLNNLTSIALKFKTDFEVNFIDTVSDAFWAEDRLVQGLNVRERDYKLSIVDGPEDLMLTYFGFNDTSIWKADLTSPSTQLSSALDRSATLIDMNRSAETPVSNETVNKPVFVEGISLLAHGFPPYFLFTGEVDIITIRYHADQRLEFTVTDNIKVPLSGLKVNVNFGGEKYGTKINKFNSFPIGIKTTNAQGQVTLYNMPRGNFTIEVFKGNTLLGDQLIASSMNTVDQNMLVSSISHFPMIIIVFAAISVATVIVGFLLYRKNNK